MSTVLVLAKSPEPGRVKTRLCPPYTPEQAALVGEAALRDTLAAVDESTATNRVLVLDGAPGPWAPPGWRIVPQARGDLGARLDAAFRAVATPSVLVGMDTPQLRAAHLDQAFDALCDPSCDVVLGPALDGGYWAIGFAASVRDAFRGVPMSASNTCAVQRARLEALGLRISLLPMLRDVDHYDDALAVARLAPSSQLAHVVRLLAGAQAR